MARSTRPGPQILPPSRRRWKGVEGAVLALVVGVVLAGCATPDPPAAPNPVRAVVPADALVVQRAVLTLRGRQFALNGYLSRSPSLGQRLIVTENLGAVLADVLVKPDGRVFVMRSSRVLRPEWIRAHVAADLQCLFGEGLAQACRVEHPGPDHYRIHRRHYELDVRLVEVRPGPQAAELFEEKTAAKP